MNNEQRAMELIDFNDCPINNRNYGGLSGNKIGVIYQGENYIIKYPGNLRDRNLKNVVLSYSNSPVCEYIGSHIYELLGYDVHETILGTRRGKTVVACKDFLKRGETLDEFRIIKSTRDSEDEYEHSSSSSSTDAPDLEQILTIIKKHHVLKTIPGVSDRFWDMFVVDAFIGNSDRNNGNWGIIRDYDGGVILAPIFDNGGCLNSKWDDERMDKLLQNPKEFEQQASKGVVCVFEVNGKKINPFKYMERNPDKECVKAIKRNVPLIKSKETDIKVLIDDIPVLTPTQKEFYHKILQTRFEKALLPIYNKHKSISR